MCGKPTALLSNLRGDVGIAPYANGKILPFIGAWPLLAGLPALSTQEGALAHSSSSFRTAMKASLGTDTVPKVRMRFLPSFCFSSSFFFLVMSPP